MGNKKPINLSGLHRFWEKIEAWILANLQALFDNDDELDAKITDLRNIVLHQKSTDYVIEDEYSEEEVINIISSQNSKKA